MSYEQDHSHTHCYDQEGEPACGRKNPHKYCCICLKEKNPEIPENKQIKKFWDKVDVKSEKECWNWKGFRLRGGYGRLGFNGKCFYAHRFSMYLAGKIKSISRPNIDETCDHICKNKSCVNPNHLRVVDQRTNVTQNSLCFVAKNRIKKYCVNGHKFSPKNTGIYIDKNEKAYKHRFCIKCLRLRYQNKKNSICGKEQDITNLKE